MLGLNRKIVILKPYQKEWHDEYIREKNFLLSILGDNIEIEHVGSTAIHGSFAKPIIDLIIGLTLNFQTELIYKTLSENKYEDKWDDEVEGERLFVKGTEFIRTHHLHFIEKDSSIWNNYILFRDYLKQNKSAREEYTKLKKELAQKYPNNRKEYTNAKAEFINKILKK